MKTYEYQFTRLIKTLIYILIALCVISVGFSVFRFVSFLLSDSAGLTANVVIQCAVSVLVGGIGAVVALSMLKKSCYELTEKQLITRFGIIVSRYDISDIVAVHLFTKTNKLAVYFKNERYMVIVVKEEWYRDFIEELIKRNRSIAYQESEEDEGEK